MSRVCEICGKKPAAGRSIVRKGSPKYKGGIGLHTTGISKRPQDGMRPLHQVGQGHEGVTPSGRSLKKQGRPVLALRPSLFYNIPNPEETTMTEPEETNEEIETTADAPIEAEASTDEGTIIRDTDIVFDCPHCGHNLAIDYRGAGLQIECVNCGESVLVPIPDGMKIDDLDIEPGEISRS